MKALLGGELLSLLARTTSALELTLPSVSLKQE